MTILPVSMFLLFTMLLYFLTGTALAASDPTNKKTPLTPISIQLHWHHQYEFAGIYAAVRQGYYARAGLDVKIKDWYPDISVLDEVVSGRADFGLGYSQLIIDYAKGVPIKLVSATFQFSPVVLVSSRPIINLRDLSHSKVMRQDILQILSLLKMARYEGATDIKEIPSSGQLTEFLSGEVDAFSAYITNEPFVLQAKKVPFYVVDPKSYGIQSYDDLLFTSQALAERSPDLVERFKQATNEGWRYAISHPEEMVDIILQHYPSNKSREALLAEAKSTEKHVKLGEVAIGAIEPAKVLAIAASAKDLGLLSEAELSKLDAKSLIFFNDKPLLTDEELLYLQRHPIINIANSLDWAPFEFIDGQGNYAGLAADYFKLFEQKLGVTFAPVKDIPWSDVTEMVLRGDLPVFSCAVSTPDRSQYINFTRPYLSFPMVLVAKDGERFIERYDELAHHKIAVVKGYWSQEYLKRNYSQIELVVVDSLKEGLQAVLSGRVYGLSDNLAAINYEIKQSAIVGLQVIGQADARFDLAIGVHNSEPLLLSILQKTLDQVSPEQAREMYNRWVHLDVVTKVDYLSMVRMLLPYMIAILVFSFLLALWLFFRRKEQGYRYQLMEAQNKVALEKATYAESQAEQEAKYSKEQAEFFAMIAHEIKTPIAMIDGALQSLKILDDSKPEEIEKRKERIDRAAKRLNHLVDRFLQQGKLDTNRFELLLQGVDLSSFCLGLVPQYKGHQIIRCHLAEQAMVMADIGLLSLAVGNLLDNAIKYSPADTVIWLEVEGLSDETGDWCLISVKDSGRGVDRDRVEMLFRPYLRGKNLGDIPGVGLGLYMVNKIAILHQGSLSYRPQPNGRGSIFTLKLPKTLVH
jgi:signal transduction histidine kinase/ABC-type nitrate/sulfonate/bicarbonate transport system substrate-binding protein